MNWFSFKSKQIPNVSVAELSVRDYPFGQYTVYWEKMVAEVNGGWSCILKILTHQSSNLVYEKQIICPTKNELTEKVNKILVDEMQKYKR